MGDVGGDGVETFFDNASSPADLGLLRTLRREMGIFDVEGKGANDFSAVPARDAADERVREPAEHPLIRVGHPELRPGAMDEGGDRDETLLDGVGTAFTLGGKSDPDVGNGTGPGAGVFNKSEKLGQSIPD